MRVAAISDIHGNLPALEAVLADIEREGIEEIVVAGDTVSGPWPLEVFERVLALDALIVRGNADRLVVEGGEGNLGAWSADRLGDRLEVVARWPLTIELEVEGLGRVLACHATPESDEVVYTRVTPDEEMSALFAGVDADVIVCGHTHIQYDRQLPGGLRIVNPGSVGLPYEGQLGAYWAVLGPDVTFRRSEYDVEHTVESVRAGTAPVGKQLLELLATPPTADEATAHHETLRGA